MGNAKKKEVVKNRNAKSKKSIVFFVILILVIVFLVGIIVFLLTRSSDEPVENRATIVTEDNVDEVLKEMNEPVENGYYNCQMNVDWNFTDSTQPSYNAYVANSEVNERTVYFDVNLEEDDKLVYSSPYIPVGEELKEIILTEKLSAGDYPAVVTYHLVDVDEKELSSVSVSITLHIEN